MDIAQANEAFGIPGVLQICAGAGGFPLIAIDNAHARAEVCGYGGQVLSYRPVDEPHDLLFKSRQAWFQAGKAIKGGIPICWPWFGSAPPGSGRGDHGFVRTRHWRLLATEVMVDGATRLRLGIHDDEVSRALWPHAFSLELEIIVGRRLSLELISHNPGATPLHLTQGLHSYFRVGDVRRTQVLGLAGYDYIDKVPADSDAVHTQSGPINFDGPVNRIYLDTADELIIDDPVFGRSIVIARTGSRSAVVWNPWIEQSRAMADFGDDEYHEMLCVESTNTATDALELLPGATHRLGTVYSIRRDTLD
ncbi:MAG: D-hexose-6-phosphate mutarotase [Chromatiaceae bacterium]|nr:MAG: D-hexose-6-phosphate mutarotase [Chromatiaceae bacterium]